MDAYHFSKGIQYCQLIGSVCGETGASEFRSHVRRWMLPAEAIIGAAVPQCRSLMFPVLCPPPPPPPLSSSSSSSSSSFLLPARRSAHHTSFLSFLFSFSYASVPQGYSQRRLSRFGCSPAEACTCTRSSSGIPNFLPPRWNTQFGCCSSQLIDCCKPFKFADNGRRALIVATQFVCKASSTSLHDARRRKALNPQKAEGEGEAG